MALTSQPKPILKKESSSKKSLTWNESNLQEMEQIKAELDCKKIDEPKTPYHGPIDDDGATIAPLSLDDEEEEKEVVKEREQQAVQEEQNEGPLEFKKTPSFEQHRKEHYQMAEAFKKGKNMVEKELQQMV